MAIAGRAAVDMKLDDSRLNTASTRLGRKAGIPCCQTYCVYERVDDGRRLTTYWVRIWVGFAKDVLATPRVGVEGGCFACVEQTDEFCPPKECTCPYLLVAILAQNHREGGLSVHAERY